MTYFFDLSAEDYSASSIAVSGGFRRLLRPYATHSLWLFLPLPIILTEAFSGAFSKAILVSVVVAAVYLLASILAWPHRVRRLVRRQYAGRSRIILGAHSLELSSAGLTSVGPQHRAFRTWASVTEVTKTSSHYFFSTLFGNVYVLPLRAVDSTVALDELISQYLPRKGGDA